MACATYTGGLPTATGTVSSKVVIEVAAGEVFNGGQKNYDRGSGACSGLSEGVFYLHEGATLQNVTISTNQAEDCTLKFVWDAITIVTGDCDTNIIGGGAYHAEDKVIQYNGCGTVNIINFFCQSQCKPNVHTSGVYAKDGKNSVNMCLGMATIIDSC
ncbi:polysaccharide lyase family 3 protein [Armillaria borealis]|uniref:Pectate lyase n=1 Tax=Armillaria borealis TaxID=47425 RepID=A0AA39J918_9AGAR|nr:polysaccharide lyase family 3 protein [Armillaria borealis]